jgi:hypothetical protein
VSEALIKIEIKIRNLKSKLMFKIQVSLPQRQKKLVYLVICRCSCVVVGFFFVCCLLLVVVVVVVVVSPPVFMVGG